MSNYNIGDVWWVHFPYDEKDQEKYRPAIIIDDETIAILAIYVTSQNKENPFSIYIEDWKSAGLKRASWARIDRIISINEWYMGQKSGKLSERDKIKILQLAAESLSNTCHEFSLLAVKKPTGEYLQIFDSYWKCWLFPYIKSTDDNKANVDTFASNLLKRETVTEYVTSAKHCKYSIRDQVYKIYNHKLYKVLVDASYAIPENSDHKLRWMSVNELESNSDIMEKNDDVIAFVKTSL